MKSFKNFVLKEQEDPPYMQRAKGRLPEKTHDDPKAAAKHISSHIRNFMDTMNNFQRDVDATSHLHPKDEHPELHAKIHEIGQFMKNGIDSFLPEKEN
mgnify:FL=1|tara:strand:+ start:1741 stop:2034 length:294 start_codon:yes stop_codon:yes gene_type:complete